MKIIKIIAITFLISGCAKKIVMFDKDFNQKKEVVFLLTDHPCDLKKSNPFDEKYYLIRADADFFSKDYKLKCIERKAKSECSRREIFVQYIQNNEFHIFPFGEYSILRIERFNDCNWGELEKSLVKVNIESDSLDFKKCKVLIDSIGPLKFTYCLEPLDLNIHKKVVADIKCDINSGHYFGDFSDKLRADICANFKNVNCNSISIYRKNNEYIYVSINCTEEGANKITSEAMSKLGYEASNIQIGEQVFAITYFVPDTTSIIKLK